MKHKYLYYVCWIVLKFVTNLKIIQKLNVELIFCHGIYKLGILLPNDQSSPLLLNVTSI